MEIKETDYETFFMEGIYGYVKACFKLNDGFIDFKDDGSESDEDLEEGMRGIFNFSSTVSTHTFQL